MKASRWSRLMQALSDRQKPLVTSACHTLGVFEDSLAVDLVRRRLVTLTVIGR